MCPVWLQHQPGAVRKPRVPVDALPRPRLRTSAAMPTNNAASGNRKRSRRDMAGGGTRQGDSGGYRAVKQRSHRPRRPHDRNRDSEADMSGGGVTGGAGGVNCGAGSGSSRRRAPRSNSTSRGQPKKRRDDERGTAHCSRIDRLMQSGLGLGVRCPNVLYRQRMALARRAIAEGDTVLTVPDDACITADTPEELAETLATQLLGRKSMWWQYLEFLPRELPGMPMLWPKDAQQRLLGGTGTLQRCREDETRAVAAAWRSTPLSRALVSAYSFNLGPQRDPIPAMVPLFDALNHRQGLCNVRLHHDEEREELSMIATRDIAKGEELVNNYGKLGSAQLLRCFGFVEGGIVRLAAHRDVDPGRGMANGDVSYEGNDRSGIVNPYDSVEVPVSLPPRPRKWYRIFADGLPEPGFPGTVDALARIVDERLCVLVGVDEKALVTESVWRKRGRGRHMVWWLELVCLRACDKLLSTSAGRLRIAQRMAETPEEDSDSDSSDEDSADA